MKSMISEAIAAGLCICLFCACGGETGDGKHALSGQTSAPASPAAPVEVGSECTTALTETAQPVTTAIPTATSQMENAPATAVTPTATVTVPAPVTEPVTTGNPNIVCSAQVTLQGGPFFTNGWGNGKTVDATTVVDGLFLPRNTQWDQGPVWWDSRDGVERSIMIELDGRYRIDSFIVQADDNDVYVLSYRDPSTGSWLTAWNVPNYDVVPSSSNWGMQTRPDPENDRARYILPAPIETDALRIAGDMKDSDRYFSVSEVQAFGVPSVPPAPPSTPACVSPSPRLDALKAGYGTPVIDGVMNASEWSTAARFDFQANLPPFDGGGTTPASVYVMNDGVNLYFALKLASASFGGATNPSIIFDNNDDNCPAEGDDGFGMYVGTYSPPTLSDIYRYSCPGAPVNSVGCSAYDTETSRGILPAGTTEGRTAAKNDGTYTIIELSHPLNSGDGLHDLALRPGDSVGFHLSLRLFSQTTSCNYGWNCMADTEMPAIGSYNAYVRITTAAGAPY